MIARVALIAALVATIFPTSFGDADEYWKPVRRGDLIGTLRNVLPGGIALAEGQLYMLYVCRLKHKNGNWLPGHLVAWETVTCYIADKDDYYRQHLTDKTKNPEDVQVLSVIPGCVNWVAVSPDKPLPEDMLPGGTDSDGEIIPVCRAFVEGYVRIGNLNKNSKECTFEWWKTETQSNDVDVLVVNKKCTDL